MIVVVNGGYRTGSTFVYNVVRELFVQNELTFVDGVRDAIEILSLVPKVLPKISYVFKSHNWLPRIDLEVKTIYTRRNYLDVYASLLKADIVLDLDIVVELREEQRREKIMLTRPCLTLEYRDFYDNEFYAVDKIAEYLELEGDLEKITNDLKRQVVKKVIDSLETLNKVTLYHPRHISDDASPGNFIDVLNYEEIEKLVRGVRNGG